MGSSSKDNKNKDKDEITKLLYEQEQTGLERFEEVYARQSSSTSIIPSSSGTQLAYRTLLAGKENLGDLPQRIKKSTNGKSDLEIEGTDSVRILKLTRAGGSDEFEIDNIELLHGGKQGSSVRKMFIYLLSQTAAQALNNGEIVKPTIIISYNDLISIKMYKNAKTAGRGIERAFDVLSKIRIKGYTVRRGKKQKREQVEAGVLFYHMKKTGKGSVIISLNENINWGYIAQPYTMLPNEYYALPSNAADLLQYIFYLARQKHEDIRKNKGEFKISYRSIQRFLMLPDVETATNPTAQIKNPIDEAIGNIMENVDPELIELIPDTVEYINITEYLEKHCLKVRLKGEYLKYFTDYFSRIEKQIAAENKRMEKNKDIAVQKAMQKNLETADEKNVSITDNTQAVKNNS